MPATPDHLPTSADAARAIDGGIDGARRLHGWFGLSYANYLTLPRSIMRAMPDDWQGRMADLLRELDDAFDRCPEGGSYTVRFRDGDGKYARDHLAEYRHPDRDRIESLRKKP